MTQVTDVVAAVMLRGDPAAPEFLLAQRPPGKVYAGYWEFPGGKVEPGETARTALVRELQEELGITVEQAWPWVCCEFSYPHATVRLRFFRVHAWHGEPSAIEHSGLIWLPAGATASVAPILPANDPILRALALPSLYALSNAEESGVAAELERLQHALANGLRLFQVRDKTLPPRQRHAFARQVMGPRCLCESGTAENLYAARRHRGADLARVGSKGSLRAAVADLLPDPCRQQEGGLAIIAVDQA